LAGYRSVALAVEDADEAVDAATLVVRSRRWEAAIREPQWR
jgi:hypothetical protein